MGYGTLPLGFLSRCISLSACFSLTGSSWQEISLYCCTLPTLRLAVFGLRGRRQLAFQSVPSHQCPSAGRRGLVSPASVQLMLLLQLQRPQRKNESLFWRNACRTLKGIRCSTARHTSLQPKHLQSFHLHTHAHTSRCGISEAVNKSDKRPPFQSTSALPRKYRGTPRLLSHSQAWRGGAGARQTETERDLKGQKV